MYLLMVQKTGGSGEKTSPFSKVTGNFLTWKLTVGLDRNGLNGY